MRRLALVSLSLFVIGCGGSAPEPGPVSSFDGVARASAATCLPLTDAGGADDVRLGVWDGHFMRSGARPAGFPMAFAETFDDGYVQTQGVDDCVVGTSLDAIYADDTHNHATITSAGETARLELVAESGWTQLDPGSLPDGSRVRVAGDGEGEIPDFSLDVDVPSGLRDAQLTDDRDGLVLSGTPPAGAKGYVYISLSRQGELVTCAAPIARGAVRVPASIAARFPLSARTGWAVGTACSARTEVDGRGVRATIAQMLFRDAPSALAASE